MYELIKKEAAAAITELINGSKLKKGDIIVVGCSSSEILGSRIGKGSSPETGRAVVDAILPVITENGLYLAAQCCEHLNRALVLEREAAERHMYDEVCVRPMPKAGGSFATAAYESMSDPVVVEFVRASAGLDIGNTLIGMHLKHVAVPLRLETKKIGEAHLNAAYTRPKLIGGIRAHYPE
ncbi:MAG: TIGR01440 family protein [Oscillospiraceae bacterium]|nr:TIGR01440 family protein [Oscillospiraceae bacterium]